MRVPSIVFLALTAAALSTPVFGRCPDSEGFRKFTASDVNQCTGKTFKQSTGPQRIPEIGINIHRDNPDCGSRIRDVIFHVDWDGNGSPKPSVTDGGLYDRVKCKRLTVKLPPDATICGIRYWASKSHDNYEGTRLHERTGLRNTGKGQSHNFARKCPTLIRSSKAGTEIRVVYKNWRKSYGRHFQFEVEYQLPPRSQGKDKPSK